MALINVDERKKREEFPEIDVDTVVSKQSSKIKITSDEGASPLTWLLQHKIVIVCGVFIVALIVAVLIGIKKLAQNIVPDDHEHEYVGHLCKYCNKEETYDITYYDESGAHTVSYSYFSETITKPKLTEKLGYIASWGETVETEDGSKTVEAVYTIINFNINYNISIEGIESNNENPLKYTVNDTIELKDLNVEGYYFSGWYSDPEYKDKITSIDKGTVGDLEIYGKIDPNQTILSFNLNGGSGNIANVRIPALGSYTFEEVDVTKRTYKFLGWSLTKDGEVKYQVGDTMTVSSANAKMTVFAVWQKNKTTITFNANGGEGEDTTQTFECFVPTDLKKVSFTRNAASLIGWSTTPEGELEYTINGSFTAGEEETTLTLYAKWKTNSNTIVFDSNGGIGQMTNITVESLTSIALPQNGFSYEGSKFIGWSTVKDGSVEYKDQSIYLANAENTEVKLYAIWAVNDVITIKFNNNGGVGYAPTMTVELLSTVSLPTTGFTKPGLTFAGWATSSLGEITYVDTYTYNTRILGSEIELFAIYSENRTIIRFKANGGEGTMENQEINAGKNANLNENTFTNSGYKFLGWSYTKDGSVDVYDKAYMEAENKLVTIELYAVWERNITTIVYVKNGSTGAMLNQEVESNSQAFLQDNKFTKDVSYFLGWALEPTGEVVYTNKQVFTAGANTETVYLYAIFKTNRTVFHFNANGGDGEMADFEIAYSSKGNIPDCEFTYTNYSFVGWCRDAIYEGQEMYTANQEFTTSSDYTVIELFAIWRKNKTTIEFTSTDSTGQMDSIEVSAGETVNLPLNTFEKTGYSFIGWAIGNKDITTYADGEEFTGFSDNTTITLTAVWEINKVIITFNANGGTGYIAPLNLVAFQKTYLPECTYEKENMHFIGWELDAGDFVANYEANQELYTPTDAGEIICYALWENNIQELTLIYDTDSRHETTIDFDVYNGQTITFIPEKENYEFLGWYKWEPDGVNYYISYAPNSFVVYGISTEYKLYAVFKEYEGSLGLMYEAVYDENSTVIGYAVTNYVGQDKNVIIPAKYNNKNILEIKDNAFLNNTNITSVKIVNYVTRIGDNAFKGCSNLASIDLSNCLVTIGSHAFDGTDIESIVLPNTVTTVGDYAFANIDTMTSITLSTSMTAINEGLFNNNSITSIVIPSGIETIGKNAFNGALCLTSVTFNEGLETIGEKAFYYCLQLEEANLPNSLTKIESSAFEACVLLDTLTFGNSLERIEDSAFKDCEALGSIVLPNSLNFIGEKIFYSSSITSIVINGTAKYINSYAFASCDKLTSVVLPSTTEIIFTGAFEGCTLLTNIVIPSSTGTIMKDAFKNTSLSTIYYGALESGWIDVAKGTDALPTTLNVYYYSELEPVYNVENYWHYVNGNPRRWTIQQN